MSKPVGFSFTQTLVRACAFVLVAGASTATAQTPGPESGEISFEQSMTTQAALGEKLASSIVRVEYRLRYDGSDTPVSRGWNQRCPNCGNYHSDRIEPIVQDQRPLERAGFAVSPDRIVTAHLMVHPRFIDSIRVVHDGQSSEATVSAYTVEQNAVLLDLDTALPGLRPLEFGPDPEGPLFSVAVTESGGHWTTSVKPFAASVLLRDDGPVRFSAQPESVVVDAEGRTAGVIMTEELALDETWQSSPLEWKQVDATHLDSILERQETSIAQHLPRVSLQFRSPREEPGTDHYAYMNLQGNDDENATEREAIGIRTGENLLVVLAHLSPSTTGRLEEIEVHLPERDQPVDASFVGSLTDFGAFVVRLDEEAGPGIRFNEEPMESLRGHLLLSTDLEVRGEQLRTLHEPSRIAGTRKGRHGVIYPDMAGEAENLFLFDREGALVAFPLKIRERSVGQQNRWRTPEKVLAPASLLAKILRDLDGHSDPANVPVDPETEGRLAWLGVDIQSLDAGLARDFQVASETDDGATGALVSFVFEDSPAAAAGIEAGDILLRVTADGLPRPFPVQLDRDGESDEPFPWEHLDEIPDEYYSYLPPPWTSFANSFNQFLTELGVGRNVVIDAVREAEPVRYSIQLVQGPAHFEAAPQFKSDEFGLTVRELTFETRRFFRKEDQSPGLIVSRIEPGSAASSGGLKPFELITHVNGEPVVTVAEFEEAAAESELRLSVQRMHQGRIAVIRKAGGN